MIRTMLLTVAILATTLSFAQTPSLSKTGTPAIEEFQGLIDATKANDLKRFTAEWEMLAKKYTDVAKTFKEAAIAAGIVNPSCGQRCSDRWHACMILGELPPSQCDMNWAGCLIGCSSTPPSQVSLLKSIQPAQAVIKR